MKILVTGAGGFVGKHMTASLAALRDGKDRTRPELQVKEVFSCGRNTPPEVLKKWCLAADFVFHLAAANRPEDPADYMAVNRDFTAHLLGYLRERDTPCPVVLASSVHAARGESLYGASKLAAEELVKRYGRETGARVVIYRLPNLFGKWSNPDYNSVTATFCYRHTRGLPLEIHDGSAELELACIDDVIAAFLDELTGRGPGAVNPVYRTTVGELARRVEGFSLWPLPRLERGSPEEKLFAAWLSFLPPERLLLPRETHRDGRGAFAELLRTEGGGQLSVNVTAPGAVRGQHWHHSKWEVFFAVSGRGVIRLRPLFGGTVTEFELDGAHPAAVMIPPGWVHSIENRVGDRELVTVIWADRPFDPDRPDTFSEEV